jgi:hypothetical protein
MIISILIIIFIIFIIYPFLYCNDREGMTDSTSASSTTNKNLSQQNSDNIVYLHDNTQILLKDSYNINNTKTQLQNNINSLQDQINNFISEQTNKLPSTPPVITGAV